jgi:TetR/AcrR family transcriptional regulator|nr:TetR/AcrR family transcriptional regulator [uncultured Lachnoclostridium sp.]
MPRTTEQNEIVRETRKKQILEAALTVYVRLGYYGTDMDTVAAEAKLAKGLVYYYYKTKKDLFEELFVWMFKEGEDFSNTILEHTKDMDVVEQLMRYAYAVFGANKKNPRMMQFFMRAPFDAYAVFGKNHWKEGAEKSDLHRRALTEIIKNGMEQKAIPIMNPSSAANSFWTVFVANLFEYSRLILGTQETLKSEGNTFRDVVQFCFQGLGIEYKVWNTCLEKIVSMEE